MMDSYYILRRVPDKYSMVKGILIRMQAIVLCFVMLFFVNLTMAETNGALPLAEVVNIDGESITNVPECIFASRHLRYLTIQTKIPFRFPPAISQLTNLIELTITYYGDQELKDANELTLSFDNCFPHEIIFLNNLHTIRLRIALISKLPEEILHLPNLKHLVLQRCLVNEPDNLYGMTKLEHLELCENRLSGLSPQIKNLYGLKKLNLRNNTLKEIPDELYELRNLEELIVSQNQISCLSSSITNLVNLHKLDIANTRITDNSDYIQVLRRMHSLKKLRVFDMKEEDLKLLKTYLPNCEMDVITKISQ